MRITAVFLLLALTLSLISCQAAERSESATVGRTSRSITYTDAVAPLPTPTEPPTTDSAPTVTTSQVTTVSPTSDPEPEPPSVGEFVWNPYVFDRLSGEYAEDAAILADAILAYDPVAAVSPDAAEVLVDNFAFEFPPAALVELSAEGDAVEIRYLYSKEEHQQKLEDFEAKVNLALSAVSAEDSEFRRAKLLYDYVVANVTYFYTDYTDKEITAFSALTQGVTICYGFADAFGYLLRQVGMEAHLWRGGTYTATGFSDHGWCYAKIDGNYYHFDPTWEYSASKSDGVNRHLYFGMSDSGRFVLLSRQCVSGFGALEEVCDPTQASSKLQIVG